MSEELTPDEKTQMNEMKAQEPADQAELAKPETQAEPEKPETPPPEPKMVPVSAVQEERERRKVAEEARRQAELNQARLDERIKAINERLTPKEQPREIPDPEKDAMGTLKATAEEVKELKRFQMEHRAQLEQQARANDVMRQAAGKEAEFMKDNGDYGDASSFLRQSRYNELTINGLDPWTANNTIMQESLALAAQALQQGKNPAEVVYSLAKARGYAKKTTVQPAQPESDAAKLARVAEGQKLSASLGNVPSTPGKPAISGKDLLAMDEDEFSTFLDKLPEKQRSKFLGA